MRGFIVTIPWFLVIVFAVLALVAAVLILFFALHGSRRSDDLADTDEGEPMKKRFCPYCGADVQLRDRICSNCDEVL